MRFYGTSRDPDNRPAARAEFYGNVRSDMEDGLLYCTKIMTTFTDQPIPLAELGKMSQAGSGYESEGYDQAKRGERRRGGREAEASI